MKKSSAAPLEGPAAVGYAWSTQQQPTGPTTLRPGMRAPWRTLSPGRTDGNDSDASRSGPAANPSREPKLLATNMGGKNLKKFGISTLLGTALLALVAGPASAQFLINELRVDHPGTDVDEYVEI